MLPAAALYSNAVCGRLDSLALGSRDLTEADVALICEAAPGLRHLSLQGLALLQLQGFPQYSNRTFLTACSDFMVRADATGAARLTGTVRGKFKGGGYQFPAPAEKRIALADAAWVVIVKHHVRLESGFHFR